MDDLTTVATLPDDRVNDNAAHTRRRAGWSKLNPVRYLHPVALGLVVAYLVALPMIIILNRAGQDHGTERMVRPDAPGPTTNAPQTISATASANASPSGSPTASASHGASPSPSPSKPTALAPTSYEAESRTNSLGSGARVDLLSGASGGAAVYAIGGPDLGTLQFNGIAAPANRTYRLIIYYQNPDQSARSGALSVNGASPVLLSFGPTAACCATKTVSIALPAGAANTIQFSGPAGKAPDIDRIVVADPPGNTP